MSVELYHRDTGQGLPVVLLHAFPVSSAMWLSQREALAPAYRVITPDQRGFGGGARRSAPTTPTWVWPPMMWSPCSTRRTSTRR